MYLSWDEMKKINDVQVEMLRDVTEACKKLNICYYMVHGSLLGTVRNSKFVPGDDDIDIAFLRKDYETFIEKAPELLNKNYFIQANTTEERYPLEFAKLRDSRTTYVIESARHLPMNHGVYIDIFPIDYVPARGKISKKIFDLRLKLLKFRVRSVWNLPKNSFAKEIVSLIAKVYCPKVRTAVRRIDKMLISDKESALLRVSGGKPKEQGIPKSWFETTEKGVFEGVEVWIPVGYSEYLTKIYGDYENRTLLENKEVNEEGVEINACIVDVSRPYTEYVKF
ncbi:MAG: LicD family protein [Agathobacter sp.]|nr:LicD family protein [Agathobacter sp.]